MLTFTKSAAGPGFPSTSSLLFLEAVAIEFFLNDLIGGQPTTCALSHTKIYHIRIRIFKTTEKQIIHVCSATSLV